jgi:hypothetical protein
MRRKILMGVLAIALPIGAVAAVQGTAFAKKVTGTGTTTCHFGGTISFNPPLSSAGTPGVKKEVTTVAATLAGCTGGTPVGSATSVAVKPIKSKVAKGQNAGTCSSFDSSASTIVVKVKINWAGEKPSKFSISGLSPSVNGAGEVGFTGHMTVGGSYAGAGSLGVFLTSASSNAIATCSGSISSLSIDASNSSSSL